MAIKSKVVEGIVASAYGQYVPIGRSVSVSLLPVKSVRPDRLSYPARRGHRSANPRSYRNVPIFCSKVRNARVKRIKRGSSYYIFFFFFFSFTVRKRSGRTTGHDGRDRSGGGTVRFPGRDREDGRKEETAATAGPESHVRGRRRTARVPCGIVVLTGKHDVGPRPMKPRDRCRKNTGWAAGAMPR